jgi:hypothetical protein
LHFFTGNKSNHNIFYPAFEQQTLLHSFSVVYLTASLKCVAFEHCNTLNITGISQALNKASCPNVLFFEFEVFMPICGILFVPCLLGYFNFEESRLANKAI